MPQWEYCSIQYHDNGDIAYYFYGQKELEETILYEDGTSEGANDITSRCVALLGLHGWEAINVLRREDGMEHWYFKRRLHPNNQYLTF